MKKFVLFITLFSFLSVSACDDDDNNNGNNNNNNNEICGNGIIDSGEECDGTELGSNSCDSLGYYGGTLACGQDCRFDVSSCENTGKCGDGILQTDYEDCDATNLNGTSCETAGFHNGALVCNNNCQFDFSDCISYGKCGDGILQTDYEDCDATNLNGNTCLSMGYQDDPDLSCSSECIFDFSDCKVAWRGVYAGGSHTCAIKIDGTAYCWGKNTYGQLGTGNTIDNTTPLQVGSDTDWAKMALGTQHSCAIKTGGTLYCWGKNNIGQLGTGNTIDNTTPFQVGSDTDWESVTASFDHTCAVKTNGKLYCWGYSTKGALGSGTQFENYSIPMQVGSDADWAVVSTAYDHTCAVKTNGKLYCWGENNFGTLGTGGTVGDVFPYPVQVGSDADWENVTTGGESDISTFTCALKTDGSVYCWGNDDFGQLGLSIPETRYTPTLISDPNDWMFISAGAIHVCGLKTDNSLHCWGRANNGALGLDNVGIDNIQYVPAQVGDATDWTAVGGGDTFTCAIENGSLYCSGYNLNGQLGVGDTNDREYFTRIDY